jgi:hypothetical protein
MVMKSIGKWWGTGLRAKTWDSLTIHFVYKAAIKPPRTPTAIATLPPSTLWPAFLFKFTVFVAVAVAVAGVEDMKTCVVLLGVTMLLCVVEVDSIIAKEGWALVNAAVAAAVAAAVEAAAVLISGVISLRLYNAPHSWREEPLGQQPLSAQ